MDLQDFLPQMETVESLPPATDCDCGFVQIARTHEQEWNYIFFWSRQRLSECLSHMLLLCLLPKRPTHTVCTREV